MDEVNILNIPAYKRKRSISARARKKPSYLKPAKKTRARKSTTTIEDKIREMSIAENMTKPTSTDFFQPKPNTFNEPESSSETREMRICGQIDGYFERIDVAVIKLTVSLRNGDRILFETSEGLFEQTVSSMQIDRQDVSLATAGSDIGIKTLKNPKVGGNVYKVI